ncbi:hypothetical protein ACJX0J_031392, partial [Zea mays]
MILDALIAYKNSVLCLFQFGLIEYDLLVALCFIMLHVLSHGFMPHSVSIFVGIANFLTFYFITDEESVFFSISLVNKLKLNIGEICLIFIFPENLCYLILRCEFDGMHWFNLILVTWINPTAAMEFFNSQRTTFTTGHMSYMYINIKGFTGFWLQHSI